MAESESADRPHPMTGREDVSAPLSKICPFTFPPTFSRDFPFPNLTGKPPPPPPLLLLLLLLLLLRFLSPERHRSSWLLCSDGGGAHRRGELPGRAGRAHRPDRGRPFPPSVTFRTFVLGTLACCLLSFLNQFFWYRREPLSVTSVSAQIAVVPLSRPRTREFSSVRFGSVSEQIEFDF
ncbi:hypothetical protein NL676_006395 [Syzygium grande]|nr:hypothetical protein NL676_006395 [Syzygium grande]